MGLDKTVLLGIVPQRFPQFLYGVVQAMVEIYKCVRRPDSLLKFFASHYFAGVLQQNLEDLEGLNLQFDPDAMFMQFTRTKVSFKVAEAN